MCGLPTESAIVGSSWLPLMFPLGMVVGGVLVGMGLLVLWCMLHKSPPWLFLSQQARQHDWADRFPSFGAQRDASESERRRRPPDPLKW
jgi:hypothetical protein